MPEQCAVASKATVRCNGCMGQGSWPHAGRHMTCVTYGPAIDCNLLSCASCSSLAITTSRAFMVHHVLPGAVLL